MRSIHCLCFGPVLVLSLAACGSAKSPATTPRATHAEETTTVVDGCSSADGRPTRNAFFLEALSAQPTDTTPKFDDYTRDSYHVDKLDVARGLPAAAERCHVKLRALLVIGPLGPLWSYHVATFVEDGTTIRLNTLVMPHARITRKGVAEVSAEEATSQLQGIETAPLVQSGLPPAKSGENAEYSHPLLLVVYDAAGPRYFHATFSEYRDSPNPSVLIERANALFSNSRTTYPLNAPRPKKPPAP